jgi:hypothetical protein
MSRPRGAAGLVPGHGIGWQTPILADLKRCAAACRGPQRCATLWERWDEVAAGLSPRRAAPTTSGGRLAQRESASFTPRRSLVRSQYRPPSNVTETVYRHQIRPVITTGAEAMDKIFANEH